MVTLLILPLALLGALLLYQGWRLASPSKRALQAYHQEYLSHPENHGISIRATACLDEKIPTLVVEPTAPFASRGTKVREQLQARGIKLISEKELHTNTIEHTILLLHGRNGRKEDLLPVAERFCAAGLRCLIIDLPAHGESTIPTVHFGSSEWEQDLPFQVLLECSKKYHFSPSKASLWGMSMGGSFANSALADPEHGSHWNSAIIVCSLGGASLQDVSPADWVKNSDTPVMIIHGDQDNLISKERGISLFNSYPHSNKRWVEVAGGTHQNILVTPMPLYAEMLEWILSN